MIDPNILRRLQKILALAKAGIGGEKQAAEHQLHALLRKFNISMEDLENPDQTTSRVGFKFTSEFEIRLLHQIVGWVLSTRNTPSFIRPTKRKMRFYDLTVSQCAEVTVAYNAYKLQMATEMELCFKALVQANGIYAPNDDSEGEPPTSASVEEARKILARAALIDKTKLLRALNDC